MILPKMIITNGISKLQQNIKIQNHISGSSGFCRIGFILY